MVEMLRTPSWVLGLATGVTLGLTHLTKASVLPGIALFALCFAAKQALWLVRSQAERQRSSRWHVAWVALALTLLAFLATIYPYIRDSKLRFGRYFYNVNSTFYMWYDSWEEVKAGTRAFGDRKLRSYGSHARPSRRVCAFREGRASVVHPSGSA